MVQDLKSGSILIAGNISRSKPTFFVGRLGSVEAEILEKFTLPNKGRFSFKSAFRLRKEAWMSAGIWPPTKNQLKIFSEKYSSALTNASIIGEWPNHQLSSQEEILRWLSPKSAKVPLGVLDPILLAAHNIEPWTSSLAGKRVMIVSSFSKEVTNQFRKQDYLHRINLLPRFTLTTIQAPQTNGLNMSLHSWQSQLRKFEKRLLEQIKTDQPDIVLVAAGSYGMPISSIIFENGYSVIYVGGALQLLFGIWGTRWKNSKYVQLIATEHWIWPQRKSKPLGSVFVERSAYW
jgi:hypothetical protein